MADIDEFDGLLDQMDQLESEQEAEPEETELRQPIKVREMIERATRQLEHLADDLETVRALHNGDNEVGQEHPDYFDESWKDRRVQEIQDKREHLVQLLEELEDQDPDELIEGHPRYPPKVRPDLGHHRDRGGDRSWA